MKDDGYRLEEGWFPGAARWEGGAFAEAVKEGGEAVPGFKERHLQCLWYDDRLRPRGLADGEGRPVAVVHPGEWNTGAGPDFLNALLRVGEGDGAVELHGDVEVHVRAADWVRHGHGRDPRYGRVVAHVTYEPGELAAGTLPEGCIQIGLKAALDAVEDFSFDNLDLTAYPIAARAVPPPCRAAAAALPPEKRGAVLEAAGEARLQLRAAVLAAAMADKGAGQVVYEETMAALGYRPNRTAFRRLARLVPLEMLRERARGDAVRAYGLLMGAAGLLPDPTSDAGRKWDGATRDFVRACWDAWWGEADAFLARRLPRDAWSRVAVRPANRPERRLMAAAVLFGKAAGLPERVEAWAKRKDGVAADEMLRAFELAEAPYWGRRLAWGAEPRGADVALVGDSRAKEVVANLLVPAMAALGAPPRVWRGMVENLPSGEANALHRETALRLFGPDHPPSLWKTGLRRQGLVHIHHEYCLSDRTRCAACPVPEILKGFQT